MVCKDKPVFASRLEWKTSSNFPYWRNPEAAGEGIGGVRLDPERLVIACDGLGKSPLLVSQDTEQMQYFKLVRPGFEDLQIQTFSYRKIALAMQFSGPLE
jgi:hypothetical protein